MDIPEKLATFGTQDAGRKQTTKKNTIPKTKKMSNTHVLERGNDVC